MYDGEPMRENPRAGFNVPGARSGTVPILRMYGVTAAGNSVLAHIHGFTPYFWALPPATMTEADLPAFQAALEAQLASAKSKARVAAAVPCVLLVPDKQSLLGYHHGRKVSMLQIYVGMPSMVPTARGTLERGFAFGTHPSRQYVCFEANVPFTLRYMIDNDISGCNWCECPAGTYSVRSSRQCLSSVQAEVDIVYDSLVSHPPDGEWQKVAPLRILSFDIECQGRKGAFPEAEHDPVIQVANVVTLQGAATSIIRNVFTLNTCSPIVGAQVHAHPTEEAMLTAWGAFVREADPDIITGYNVQNFDIPYLLNRMRKLKLDAPQVLGRVRGVKAVMKDTTFQSSAYGKHENVETTIDGRVIFDMLQYVRREHKLSSYSLNSVSAHFLGQQKEDVHHSIIADLQAGTADDRRRLAVYCLADDHQILTDAGWRSLSDMEADAAAGVGRLVCGYDPSRECWVYERPSHLIVNPPARRDMVALRRRASRGRLVALYPCLLFHPHTCTHPPPPPPPPPSSRNVRSDVDAVGDVDLLVTPEHDMWVSVSRSSALTAVGEAPPCLSFRKVKAGDLLTLAAQRAHVTQLSAAKRGLQGGCAQSGVRLARQPSHLVGLAGVERTAAMQAAGAAAMGTASTRAGGSLPPWVWECDGNDAEALLCGMQGGGARRGADADEVHVVVRDAGLRDEVQRLALHAGFSATFQRDRPDAWTVRCSRAAPATAPVLAADVEIVPATYSGRTWCVSVPHGFIVARRAAWDGTTGEVTWASRPVITGNCLKDAFLPQKLMDKLMVIINHIEMARVTGVPLDFLLTRGQQIKVVSMLYRKCRPKGLLVPSLQKQAGGAGGEDDTFEGATVIEPKKGYYDEPIATLDFASLYPSIMMAHNLCYSTLLAPDDVKSLPPEAYEKTPDENIYFVRSSVHKGVLPEILEELLAARKRAKNDMAKATDPFVVAVQNGRQLALKISANSVYGFTGATVGQLPCLQISSSVTAYGRTMIDTTKQAVEARFTTANGYPADATVVYGDTDSVMVKFGVKDVPTAMKLGAEAAKEVTKMFPNPVKLEFEKVRPPSRIPPGPPFGQPPLRPRVGCRGKCFVPLRSTSAHQTPPTPRPRSRCAGVLSLPADEQEAVRGAVLVQARQMG